MAAEAQSIKRLDLRSLKRGATELMWVQFLVAELELGKNPSHAIYEANIEVSARFRKRVDEPVGRGLNILPAVSGHRMTLRRGRHRNWNEKMNKLDLVWCLSYFSPPRTDNRFSSCGRAEDFDPNGFGFSSHCDLQSFINFFLQKSLINWLL